MSKRLSKYIASFDCFDKSLLILSVRPTLKSCPLPIHRQGETKNSHEPPTGRNFFFIFAISLSKKIKYNTKDMIQ